MRKYLICTACMRVWVHDSSVSDWDEECPWCHSDRSVEASDMPPVSVPAWCRSVRTRLSDYEAADAAARMRHDIDALEKRVKALEGAPERRADESEIEASRRLVRLLTGLLTDISGPARRVVAWLDEEKSGDG